MYAKLAKKNGLSITALQAETKRLADFSPALLKAKTQELADFSVGGSFDVPDHPPGWYCCCCCWSSAAAALSAHAPANFDTVRTFLLAPVSLNGFRAPATLNQFQSEGTRPQKPQRVDRTS
jgi:hypothetical protein